MSMQTAPGVTQRMLPNGHLELFCQETRRQVACEPIAAAMWIALKQHNGELDKAAEMLARLWQTDPMNTRDDLIVLAGTLCAVGLLVEN
jgi:hypothetical protein